MYKSNEKALQEMRKELHRLKQNKHQIELTLSNMERKKEKYKLLRIGRFFAELGVGDIIDDPYKKEKLKRLLSENFN